MRVIPSSILVLAAALAALGCGGPEGPKNWVAVVGRDTITIEDVTRQWNRIRDREQTRFLETPAPDSAFVQALVHKELIQAAARDAGYLELPEFVALERAWSRIEKAIAAREEINRVHLSEVAQDEIESYRQRMGQIYWLKMHPDRGGRQISMHVLDLPYERVMLLDGMEPGESSVDEMGNPFRLDSLTVVDPQSSPEIDPTMYTDSTLARMIGIGRAREYTRELIGQALDTMDVSVDSVGLYRMSAYLAGDLPDPPSDVLVESDLGSWDGKEMHAEIQMARSRFPLDPKNPGHLLFLVENIFTQSVLSRHLEMTRPGMADSIESEAESFLLGAAAESMYVDSVQALSVPTRDDLLRTWETGGDTIYVEERRSLELLALPEEGHVQRFLDARDAGRLEDVAARLPFLEELSSDNPPSRFTRPLRSGDLPRQVAGRAFALSPEDTVQWYGPIGVPERGWTAFFRLREVLPSAHHDFETTIPEVRSVTQRRMEEERISEFLESLQTRYSVEINQGLLGELASDPSDW